MTIAEQQQQQQVGLISQDKVNENLRKCRNICHTMMDKFIQKVTSSNKITEKDKKEIINIMNNDVYFVGGLWRSVFTDTNFNDVDVAFRSLQASIKMKHFSLKYSLIKLTDRGNGYVDGMSSTTLGISNTHRLSFDFNLVNLSPEHLIGGFDFTFNRNYYDRKNMAERVDRTVITKAAKVPNFPKNPMESYAMFRRMIRFSREGFDFTDESLDRLFDTIAEIPKDVDIHQLNMYNQRTRSGDGMNSSDGLTSTGIISERAYTKRNGRQEDIKRLITISYKPVNPYSRYTIEEYHRGNQPTTAAVEIEVDNDFDDFDDEMNPAEGDYDDNGDF